MEIVAHESADHEVYCLRDGNRMAVLILDGSLLVHGEAAGCFDDEELRSFIDEARGWLVANGHVRSRSGQYAAFRPDGARQHAAS
jgi:hypothetical protein